MFQQGSRAALFLELAKPGKNGFSRKVQVEEFVGKYQVLEMGNGGSWCRDDGGLARHFNIRRGKEGGKIVYVELQGFKKIPIKKPIPAHIKHAFKSKRCALLGIGKVEIDHKDGRRDDPRLNDASRVTVDDFQPLSKPANMAKRQHCKVCRDTGKRFDARKLGYAKAQIEGNGTYNGTCIGCFWYDIHAFNKAVSE